MEIQSQTNASAATSAAANAQATVSDTFDNFLLLLTTQLQHQDPLEPMDSNEFTQQLVQFTNVEQNIATNTNLEKLLQMMQVGETSAAVSHLGKSIEASTPTNGLQKGQARWRYQLDDNAETANISITDASGRLVRVEPASTGSGSHDFVWDGTDNSGETLPDGAYTLTVLAEDAQGKTIPTTVSSIGLVTGVEIGEAGTMLLIGKAEVPLTSVTRLTLPEEPA